MTKLIRPPDTADVTLFMRMLFLRTERDIVNEIRRKRGAGLVDYAEAAALERVQAILQNMVDESWAYVPVMIEKIFYHSDKDAAGYANARALTVTQLTVVEQLSNNLLGEITEAASVAEKSVQDFFTIARLENDPFRQTALKQVLMQQAQGKPWIQASQQMVREMENQGIPAFVDKAGRTWSLQSYGNMAVRTTARQAQVAALLTADDHDLWQIVKIGSTCPVCAALEGRIYSKSGTNPDYPPLTLAFGKVDPSGSDDLTNTYLNIHPNCLHSLIKYTTIGKTEKQIQKDKDFSNPEKNPLNRDPRTKKQIAAYREKERNRQRLLEDMKQHKKYREIYGSKIPKDFAKFQELKYNNIETWKILKSGKQDKLSQMDFSQMAGLRGQLGNLEVRMWYKTHDEKIPDLIDKSKGIKEQAMQAFELRNTYRTQARELMKDKAARSMLDQKHKNPTFEEIMEHKKKKYGLTDEEAYQDIIRSSGTTNKKYDKIAGIGRKEES